MGHHLAQWLLAHGEEVLDVPPTATARFRSLSRGGRRKNDRIDAAAAAGSAAVHGDSRRVFPEGHTDALALLAERRQSLSQHRTRLLNQLHAVLRELIPGGAPRSLTATRAAQLLRRVRPTSTADRVRREVARDLIAEVRHHDRLVAANTEQIRKLLIEHPTTLTEIVGIGPVLAARILAGTGNPRRFSTAAAYANYARHRTDPNRQCRPQPSPALPLRQPRPQLSHPLRGDHPDPHPIQCRVRLLRQETSRGEDTERSYPLPETPAGGHRLARHDQRLRRATGPDPRAGGTGRLTIQRDHRPHGALGGPTPYERLRQKIQDSLS